MTSYKMNGFDVFTGNPSVGDLDDAVTDDLVS